LKPKGEFTSGLWKSIDPIYEELINHPFVKMLAKGTLSNDSFTHYLSQDVLYLKEDAAAFIKLSERALNISEKAFFKLMANDTIVLEQELHTHFLTHFDVVEAKSKSPAIEAYTSFLQHHSTESSYKVAAAALLPCFWVYSSLGISIVKQSTKNNIYQKWIDTYKGGEYEEYTNRFIEIVEVYGNDATEAERIVMQEVFVESTKFELAFFEESLLK